MKRLLALAFLVLAAQLAAASAPLPEPSHVCFYKKFGMDANYSFDDPWLQTPEAKACIEQVEAEQKQAAQQRAAAKQMNQIILALLLVSLAAVIGVLGHDQFKAKKLSTVVKIALLALAVLLALGAFVMFNIVIIELTTLY
jgi:hypothetical protein